MSDIQYHESTPEADNSDGFQPFDTIDFMLLADGRKLLKNSVTVEFDLFTTSNADYSTRLAIGDLIGLDNKIGGHAVFESWNCEIQSVGNVQNIMDYPRWVSMVTCASNNENDFYSARFQAEGRGVSERCGAFVLQELKARGSQGAVGLLRRDPSFCIKPQLCFNNLTGDDYSFSKNGYIKLSCNVARASSALFGGGAATANYKIKNIKVLYQTRADDGVQGMMLMNSVTSIKQTINSQQANILSRVPSDKVNGVVLSFLPQADENAATKNSYALTKMPLLDEVQYLFSDSTAKYITYVINDQSDMVIKGIEALNNTGRNMCSTSKLASNQGFIIGLPFEEYIDLTSQKFSVQLKSKAVNLAAQPMLAYLYFTTLIQVGG